MMIKALYNGEELPLSYQNALKSKGLSEQDIEDIETKAYRDLCCERFENVNYANPIIDYGTKVLEYYEALMPYISDDSQMMHRRERWDYCPFCGAHLTKRLE